METEVHPIEPTAAEDADQAAEAPPVVAADLEFTESQAAATLPESRSPASPAAPDTPALVSVELQRADHCRGRRETECRTAPGAPGVRGEVARLTDRDAALGRRICCGHSPRGRGVSHITVPTAVQAASTNVTRSWLTTALLPIFLIAANPCERMAGQGSARSDGPEDRP